MNLHLDKTAFDQLCSIVSDWKNIPEEAIARDYFITFMLQKLEHSEYVDKCVFKGGTSLSKCYPGSIERFSEDIDLTFLGMDESDKFCEKNIKKIISIMADGANVLEKIPGEGNARNHSRKVGYGDGIETIKLEIGCSIKPDPYSKKTFKSYIQEYLESIGKDNLVKKYELEPVTLLVLNVERTFLDKVMSVKRHALCGTLIKKVRHIYDVVRLYQLQEVKDFLENKEGLKDILVKTKETDSFYLRKRDIPQDYNPKGPYDFDSWKERMTAPEIKKQYEKLSDELLYSHEKLNMELAVKTFDEINKLFVDIGE